MKVAGLRPAAAGRRSAGALRRGRLDLDDHLVWPDEAELRAHQLVGEIGIDAARIEQLGAMGEPNALGFELGELDLALGLEPAKSPQERTPLSPMTA